MIVYIVKVEDICNKKLEEYLLDLFQGCYIVENGMKINRVDIGRCNKRQCIILYQLNFVDCFDIWLKYCCFINEIE